MIDVAEIKEVYFYLPLYTLCKSFIFCARLRDVYECLLHCVKSGASQAIVHWDHL